MDASMGGMQGDAVSPGWQDETREQTNFYDKGQQVERVMERVVTRLSHLGEKESGWRG